MNQRPQVNDMFYIEALFIEDDGLIIEVVNTVENSFICNCIIHYRNNTTSGVIVVSDMTLLGNDGHLSRKLTEQEAFLFKLGGYDSADL